MKKSVQSHNLTKKELLDLQRSNSLGEAPEMISANRNSDHEIKSVESHLVHLQIEKKEFDRRTGQKTSKPIVQSFYPNEFDKMVKDKSFGDLSVEILHDPRKESGEKGDAQTGLGPAVPKEKALSQMNKEELQNKYKQLYGEAPDSDLTKDELKADIEDKLAFLEEEKESSSNPQ